MSSATTVGKNCAAALIFALIGRAMMNTKGLENELGFYGAYHQNPMNQLIHFIFVPCIWWSVCIFMCYLPFPPLEILGIAEVRGHKISWGTLFIILYSVFYINLHPIAGTITSCLYLGLYLQASSAVAAERKKANASQKKENATKKMSLSTFAFILHALGWYMQIHPGHAIYEGVKPALLDSIGQAFGVAPMFAFLEGVWFVGMLPDLKLNVLKLVTENREAMCAAGQVMPWCSA